MIDRERERHTKGEREGGRERERGREGREGERERERVGGRERETEREREGGEGGRERERERGGEREREREREGGRGGRERGRERPVTDLLARELQLLSFSTEECFLLLSTVAGELHGDSTGRAWASVAQVIAGVSTTGQGLATHCTTGGKITCLTAPHLHAHRKTIHTCTCT